MKFGSAKTHRGLMVILTAVLAVLLSVIALAEEEDRTVIEMGRCGETLTWTFYSDGLLDIAGTGDMFEWDTGNAMPPWEKSNINSKITSLNLSNRLTNIGNYACSNCVNMSEKLRIPERIRSIGKFAFYCCEGLTGDLIIPKSVSSIGECAFLGCTSLNGKLVLSESLTEIPGSAFNGCINLTGEITIPVAVTTIGDLAFLDCSSFSGTLTIPENVTNIGYRAFSGCTGLSSVVFHGNAPEINDIAVFGNRWGDLTLYCYTSHAESFTSSEYYDSYTETWCGYPLEILDDEQEPGNPGDETPTDLTLTLTGATLDVGSTIQLVAVVTGDAAEEGVVWTSSDDTVASVKDGTVTALAEGTAVITAAAKAGGTPVSFEVKVNPAPAPVIRGDIDGDGFITAKDRMILARYLAGWQGYNQYFEK